MIPIIQLCKKVNLEKKKKKKKVKRKKRQKNKNKNKTVEPIQESLFNYAYF